MYSVASFVKNRNLIRSGAVLTAAGVLSLAACSSLDKQPQPEPTVSSQPSTGPVKPAKQATAAQLEAIQDRYDAIKDRYCAAAETAVFQGNAQLSDADYREGDPERWHVVAPVGKRAIVETDFDQATQPSDESSKRCSDSWVTIVITGNSADRMRYFGGDDSVSHVEFATTASAWDGDEIQISDSLQTGGLPTAESVTIPLYDNIRKGGDIGYYAKADYEDAVSIVKYLENAR